VRVALYLPRRVSYGPALWRIACAGEGLRADFCLKTKKQKNEECKERTNGWMEVMKSKEAPEMPPLDGRGVKRTYVDEI